MLDSMCTSGPEVLCFSYLLAHSSWIPCCLFPAWLTPWTWGITNEIAAAPVRPSLLPTGQVVSEQGKKNKRWKFVKHSNTLLQTETPKWTSVCAHWPPCAGLHGHPLILYVRKGSQCISSPFFIQRKCQNKHQQRSARAPFLLATELVTEEEVGGVYGRTITMKTASVLVLFLLASVHFFTPGRGTNQTAFLLLLERHVVRSLTISFEEPW